MKLSVIIPAYNEADRIVMTLEKSIDYLARQDWESEILVVSGRQHRRYRCGGGRVRRAGKGGAALAGILSQPRQGVCRPLRHAAGRRRGGHVHGRRLLGAHGIRPTSEWRGFRRASTSPSPPGAVAGAQVTHHQNRAREPLRQNLHPGPEHLPGPELSGHPVRVQVLYPAVGPGPLFPPETHQRDLRSGDSLPGPAKRLQGGPVSRGLGAPGRFPNSIRLPSKIPFCFRGAVPHSTTSSLNFPRRRRSKHSVRFVADFIEGLGILKTGPQTRTFGKPPYLLDFQKVGHKNFPCHGFVPAHCVHEVVHLPMAIQRQ